MKENKKNEKRLAELEALMASPDFWLDKNKAQELVQEYQMLKASPPEGGADPHARSTARCRPLPLPHRFHSDYFRGGSF